MGRRRVARSRSYMIAGVPLILYNTRKFDYVLVNHALSHMSLVYRHETDLW
jgi:hypothetical protein